MPESDPSDPSAVFDILAVALAGVHPPIVDCGGRSHFLFPRGMLTITATDGPTARCDVTVVNDEDELLTRQLVLDTAGAVELARCLQGILPPERGAPLDANSAVCLGLVEEFPFDVPDELPSVRARVTEVPQSGSDDPRLRERASSVLHVWSLRHQFLVGRVGEAPAEGDRPSGLVVQFPDVVISFYSEARRGEDVLMGITELPGEGPKVFGLAPAGLSLLLVVHEGLASLSMAELEADVDPDTVAAFRQALLDLQEAVLDRVVDFDAFEGFVRLVRLFDPDGRPEPAVDMSLPQLFALALVAMRKWMARRGRPASEQSVTLREIREVVGREPEWTGAEYRLLFRDVELVFELDDVAFGWLRVIISNGELEPNPFAFSAATLVGVAWAAAAHDVLTADEYEAIEDYVIGAFTDPWFDPIAGIERVVAALEAMAADRGGAAADVLREIVERAPRRLA